MQLQSSWLERVYQVFYCFPPAMEPTDPAEDSESPMETPDTCITDRERPNTVAPSMQTLIQPIMAATQMITVLKMRPERIDYESSELMELWHDEWQTESVYQELSDAKFRASHSIAIVQRKRNELLVEFRRECLAHMNRFPHMLPHSDPLNYE